jgi:1-acyl-sn-glycerol-3-phosphate acyltransferase
MSGAGDDVRISGWVWRVGQALLVPAFRLFLRLRASGRENVPAAGPTLIVSNHISYLDPPLIGAAALPRRTHFMAKAELFRIPLLGWAIRRLGAFPVVRGAADREALRIARALLAAGEAVVMFPEGTRSPDGRLRPAFTGAGALALEPGVCVVPAAVWGSRGARGPVRVVFGRPVDLADLASGPRSRRAREATRRMMAAIADLVPAAGGPPQVVPEGEPSLPGEERSRRP